MFIFSNLINFVCNEIGFEVDVEGDHLLNFDTWVIYMVTYPNASIVPAAAYGYAQRTKDRGW